MTVLQEMYETGDKCGLFARPYFCKATKSAQMDAKCNLDFYISEITSTDLSKVPSPLCVQGMTKF